jgi:hypothetical protein
VVYIKKFESFQNNSILFIVDVQKSFRDFFTEMYIHELKKYCKTFKYVYQIFDNHVDGKGVDKNYLYDDNPDIPVHDDLYHFPNQVDLIEKRYNYDVDIDFFKKILDKEIYNNIKERESKGLMKKGEFFETTEGTIIVYIGNNHIWFQVPKKLYDLLLKLKGKEISIVGGSDSECLEDIFITAESLGVIPKRVHKFIYSAAHCPIK